MKKDTQVLIKLSEDEKIAFKRASDLNGLGFSSWARQVLRKEAIIELQKVGESPDFLKK